MRSSPSSCRKISAEAYPFFQEETTSHKGEVALPSADLGQGDWAGKREGTSSTITRQPPEMPVNEIGHRYEVYQPVNLPSLDNPPAMGFDRVMHGIGGQVGSVRPLHRPHDHLSLSKDGRIA